MDMVKFIHPLTGEVRMVKLGVSWTLFFFWWFFGIPFFMRKMISYGIGAIILPVILLILYGAIVDLLFADYGYGIMFLSFFIWLIANIIIDIYLLLNGNKITAKYYIKNGFQIDEKEEYKKNAIQSQWLFPGEVFLKLENQGENQ